MYSTYIYFVLKIKFKNCFKFFAGPKFLKSMNPNPSPSVASDHSIITFSQSNICFFITMPLLEHFIFIIFKNNHFMDYKLNIGALWSPSGTFQFILSVVYLRSGSNNDYYIVAHTHTHILPNILYTRTYTYTAHTHLYSTATTKYMHIPHSEVYYTYWWQKCI